MRRWKIVLIVTVYLMVLAGCKTKEEEVEADPAEETKVYKPVIYIYPEEETDVNVTLEFEGELTFTYPQYHSDWKVTAYPDGRIINKDDGREYSYLFWEGITNKEWKVNEGFVIPGDKTVVFLQEKLEEIGLKPNEYNEFIVFWAPLMEENKYNLISFAQEDYFELAKLTISPSPDSILRVHMLFKGIDEPIKIEEQVIERFERTGFSVIEWGGTEMN